MTDEERIKLWEKNKNKLKKEDAMKKSNKNNKKEKAATPSLDGGSASPTSKKGSQRAIARRDMEEFKKKFLEKTPQETEEETPRFKDLQSFANKRKTGKEQYYTNKETVDYCLDLLEEFVDFKQESSLFLEPAGGTGEFIEGLKRKGVEKNNILSFDIEPKHADVALVDDFLSVEDLPENLITISNPPFGRANSLSKKFFNHAAKNSKMICFLIPKSWRKWSVQNSLDLNFHLVLDEEMPSNSFYKLDDEKFQDKKTLTTLFQVWERRDYKRKKVTVEDRKYLKKVRQDEEGLEKANLAITLFGYSCGKIEESFERKPNTTKGYFIAKNQEVIEALKTFDYSQFYNNTAYVKALSIKEINYLLNNYFDNKASL